SSTTGAVPVFSSEAAKSRPRNGRTPSIERKFGETASPLITSGWLTPAPARLNPTSSTTAISENAWLVLRQSKKLGYDTPTLPTFGVVSFSTTSRDGSLY